MKKNLISAIIILFVAVFSLGVTSFAFFSSNSKGDNNNVGVGDFKFENTNTKLQQTASYAFNAPTIINFPNAITKPILPVKNQTETQAAFDSRMETYNTEYATFLNEGDDEYFNNCVIPIEIKVQNNSLVDMQLSIQLVASKGEGSVADYTLNGGVQYFLLSSSQSADYLTAIRNGCQNLTSNKPTNFEKTKDILAQGIANFNTNTINKTILYGKNKDATGAIKPTESANFVTYLAVCWLDYRQYKETLKPVNGAARPDGKVKIEIAVTASQYTQEAARP